MTNCSFPRPRFSLKFFPSRSPRADEPRGGWRAWSPSPRRWRRSLLPAGVTQRRSVLFWPECYFPCFSPTRWRPGGCRPDGRKPELGSGRASRGGAWVPQLRLPKFKEDPEAVLLPLRASVSGGRGRLGPPAVPQSVCWASLCGLGTGRPTARGLPERG